MTASANRCSVCHPNGFSSVSFCSASSCRYYSVDPTSRSCNVRTYVMGSGGKPHYFLHVFTIGMQINTLRQTIQRPAKQHKTNTSQFILKDMYVSQQSFMKKSWVEIFCFSMGSLKKVLGIFYRMLCENIVPHFFILIEKFESSSRANFLFDLCLPMS